MDIAARTADDMTTTHGSAAPVHARPGLRHWTLVAAGCAAVVGVALAADPAVGTPVPRHSGVKQLSAAAAPDPAKAQLPLDCAPLPIKIALRFSADLGDGSPSTVVSAHCDSGTGTPPDGVYILAAGPGGTPVVRTTLIDPHEDLTVTELQLRRDGVLLGRAFGYSSEDVPRCCPDLLLDLSWTHHGGQWTRSETKAPATRT